MRAHFGVASFGMDDHDLQSFLKRYIETVTAAHGQVAVDARPVRRVDMRGYSMLPSGRLLAIALVASAVLAASFSSASGLARIGARRKREREPGAIIGFITDIEGDMAYLERYIAPVSYTHLTLPTTPYV